MPIYMIGGHSVDFPFEPYEVQKKFMEKVIQSLENAENAILESPTGTGKTLSLLCSSLAWLLVKKSEHIGVSAARQKLLQPDQLPDVDLLNEMINSENVPRLIYASRTHTQISQAMQELKRSGYSHVKAVVLGSRNQMCIHPDISKETNLSAQINLCKHAVKRKQCTFYNNVERRKDHEEFSRNGVMDIEDLVTAGQKLHTCPYFVSKELYKHADVIFMPYNYILDPKSRRANQIELNNTAVILDEGHNVEKMCEDSMSLQLTSTDVATSIVDVTFAMEKLAEQQDSNDLEGRDERKDISLDDLATLKEILLAFEKTIDIIKVDFAKGVTFGGEYVYDFLSQANITFGNFQAILHLIELILQYFAVMAINKSTGPKGVGLQKLSDLLVIVFATNTDSYREKVTKCYRVHVELEEQNTFGRKDGWKSKSSTTLAKVFSFWCFSPAFAMSFLHDLRCIILTSGTLAPMKPLISEMGISMPIQLENPHIVSREQVCVKVICQGSDKEPLISNYNNRDNPKYITSLGRTILSFSPVIPGGVLIFFPSYTLMSKCQTSWQESGLWTQISNVKTIFVESRNKTDFQETMTEYYAKIGEPGSRGAIFMAVCRGKVSEGLDFADLNGRAVIIPGLPFPPLLDPRVVLKKQYLDENRRKSSEMISGNDWYCLEASRAVNQAIGRVIRHRNDYGAILLCDSRFQNHQQKNQLSKWVQGHLKAPNSSTGANFGPVIGEVCRFFRNAEKKFGNPEDQVKRFDYSSMPIASTSTGASSSKSDNLLMRFKKISEKLKEESESPKTGVMDLYKNVPETSKAETPDDFLSSLTGNDVQSIDFNDVTSYEPEQHSEGAVPWQSNSQGSRKRKYKLVENERKPEVETNQEVEEQSLPENRVDFVKLVKSKVNIADYKKFVLCIHTYNSDGNIYEYFKTLHGLFAAPKTLYILRGMKRFVKAEHKDIFGQLLQRHL
ncbi:Regulator of telomere elongation helicase 1 homolog [Sergentomyia squamirostris]